MKDATRMTEAAAIARKPEVVRAEPRFEAYPGVIPLLDGGGPGWCSDMPRRPLVETRSWLDFETPD